MNEEVIGQYPISDAQDVDAAMAAAKAAFPAWSRLTPGQRQDYLMRLAGAFEDNAEALAQSQHRNTGQPVALIKSEEVAVGVGQIRFFTGAARLLTGLAQGEYMEGMTSSIRREPIGVVAQVTPWNYPFMMAVWRIAPALAAGNTIVLKPSDTTPESTLEMARIAGKILPEGVFNVVLGDASTGELLTTHPVPALCSITGSVRAGIAVATSAAKDLKRSHLELGGKAPVVVLADADIQAAAEAIGTAGFFNAGQDCTAACRVLVEKSAHDDFVKALVDFAKEVKVGSDDDALYGPLNNAKHLEKVTQVMAELPAHATVETGGQRLEGKGYFFAPTVITGLRQDDKAIQEEPFGPVITVQAFEGADQAFEWANDVQYGLASSVWTKDLSTAGLIAACEEFQPHCFVIGAGRHGALGKVSLGSVGQNLMHSANFPLGLAPRGSRHAKLKGISRLSVGIGDRQGVEPLLDLTAKLANRAVAPVRLVSIQSHTKGFSDEELITQGQADAQAAAEKLRPLLDAGIAVSIEVAMGDDISDATEDLAWLPDELTLLGSSKLAAPKRLFLGSIANKVLRVLPVPLIVVPSE